MKFKALKSIPLRLSYLMGRRKKPAVAKAKKPATSSGPKAGKVVPLRRPAPAPQPRQQPAPSRKAAERLDWTDEQDEAEMRAVATAAIRRRERERFGAILNHGLSVGLDRMALAIAGETQMTASAAIRLMDDLKEFAGNEQAAHRPRNLYTPKPRGTAA